MTPECPICHLPLAPDADSKTFHSTALYTKGLDADGSGCLLANTIVVIRPLVYRKDAMTTVSLYTVFTYVHGHGPMDMYTTIRHWARTDT